jgi:hypothetical protein
VIDAPHWLHHITSHHSPIPVYRNDCVVMCCDVCCCHFQLIASDILYLDAAIDEKMDQSPSARRLIESLLRGNADA